MNTQESSTSPGREPGGSPAAGAVGASGVGQAVPPGEQFFNRIRALGVVRPDEGRWAAGVCAGLARRWSLDPILVRGLFVVASIVSGFGLGLYGLLWMFLPHPDGRIHAQQVLRGIVTAGFIGSAVFLLVDLPLSSAAWGWNSRPFHPAGNLVFLVLVGLGIWWLMNHRTPGTPADVPVYGTPAPGTAPRPGGPESETSTYGPLRGGSPAGSTAPHAGAPEGYYAPPAATAVATAPRPVDVHRPLRPLTLTSLGVALVAAGAVLGWDRWIRHLDDAGLVATAVGLGVVALGIVLAGILGRRSGGLVPVAIVLAIVAGNGAAWQDTSLNGSASDETWTPTSASAAATGYDLGAGRAVLDLTTPGLVTGATSTSPVTVPASIGAGELVIVLPRDISSKVDASVGLGAITTDEVDGEGDRGGPGVKRTVSHGENPVLIVTAKVGLGHVEVVPAGAGTAVTR